MCCWASGFAVFTVKVGADLQTEYKTDRREVPASSICLVLCLWSCANFYCECSRSTQNAQVLKPGGMTSAAQQVETCSKGPYSHKYFFLWRKWASSGQFRCSRKWQFRQLPCQQCWVSETIYLITQCYEAISYQRMKEYWTKILYMKMKHQKRKQKLELNL